MDAIIEKVFTEAGLVAGLLLIANVVQWFAWKRERAEKERLHGEFRDFITRSHLVAPRREREGR